MRVGLAYGLGAVRLPYFRVCFVGRSKPPVPIVVQVAGGFFFVLLWGCLVSSSLGGGLGHRVAY